MDIPETDEARQTEAALTAQELVDEYEAERRPIPRETIERVDRFIVEHGVLDEPQRDP